MRFTECMTDPSGRLFPISRLVAPPLFFLTASCGSLQSNAARSAEPQPQATGALAGTGQMAVSAFRATLMAGIRQPATTLRTGLAVFWYRPKEIVDGNLPMELVPQTLPPEIPGTPEFENLLDREHLPMRESGTLSFLVDGREFFPELDRQIAKATSGVNMQFFIYDNDDVAVHYSEVLKQRAKDVPVRVLFDDLGSTFAQTAPPKTPGPRGFEAPADIANYLEKDSKVRVRRSANPWLVCDHTKLVVFDQRTAYLGGMNMGREYFSEWHDLMVKVEGPVVTHLSKEFSRAWRKAGPWGDFAFFRKPGSIRRSPAGPADVPVRLLRTDAARGKAQVLEATLLAIRAAKKRIWIENPYFAHDETAIALAAAAKRGVDVRVILPAEGDSTIMDIGNLGTARNLIQAGAKIYRYPRMTHMKAMICDGWAQAGSANLDILSMRINRELNIAFSDPKTIRKLEQQVFLPDFASSKRIRFEETSSPVAPLAETVADQL